jgi:hypothetical protein
MKQKDIVVIQEIRREKVFHQFSRWSKRINLRNQSRAPSVRRTSVASVEVFNDFLHCMGSH